MNCLLLSYDFDCWIINGPSFGFATEAHEECRDRGSPPKTQICATQWPDSLRKGRVPILTKGKQRPSPKRWPIKMSFPQHSQAKKTLPNEVDERGENFPGTMLPHGRQGSKAKEARGDTYWYYENIPARTLHPFEFDFISLISPLLINSLHSAILVNYS